MNSEEFATHALLMALPTAYASLTADGSFTGGDSPEQHEKLQRALIPAAIFALGATEAFEQMIQVQARERRRGILRTNLTSAEAGKGNDPARPYPLDSEFLTKM
jgi:hypothetical protein